MKKLLLIDKKTTIVLLVVLIICLGLYSVFFRQPSITVVKTSPESGSLHNPYLPVTVFFSRPIAATNGLFTITPDVDVSTLVIKENGVQISPRTTFNQEILYTITVNVSPPHIFSFTTEQLGSNAPGWNDAVDKAHDEYLEKFGRQDEALMSIRSRTPIKEKGFSVNYSYADNTYTITVSPPYALNKELFLSWIKGLGVTDSSTVRIKYVNQ